MAERSDHSDRDKRDRIKRLRERLANVQTTTVGESQLVSVLRGVLDLLADEL